MYNAVARHQWQGLSPRLSALATPQRTLQCMEAPAKAIRWKRAVDDTVSDLIVPGVERQTFRTDSDVFNH